MKIIELTAENIKRLKAVQITPDGTVQVVGGRNAQGKTSVLDAIWLALGGGAASKATTHPVRDGETNAKVRLDLEDIIVTRTWKGDKTTLVVQSADGAKYSGPQGILDALVGRLSFDPLAFTRLSDREQAVALMEVVDLDVDLDTLNSDRQALYDQRTDIGREGKALGNTPTVDPKLPNEEQSAQAILTDLRAAEDTNRDITAAQRASTNLTERIAELERELAANRESLKTTEATATREAADTAALEAKLATVEQSNAAIRANNDAKTKADHREALRKKYDALTADIESLDKKKSGALAAAKFPVAGLSFDENGVTYNGVPFTQAASSEQIRVSLAMAMALNPKLRVVRILDGSLLDSDSLTLIQEMARDNDYQVWIERVGDADEGAVIIEDGAVSA